MNEITRSERIASERLSSLESPTRRLLIKGWQALVRRLCLPRSLGLSLLRLISRGLLAIRYLQTRLGGDLLLHRAVKVDISKLFTSRPQPKRSCRLVSYTPSGFLTISRP